VSRISPPVATTGYKLKERVMEIVSFIGGSLHGTLRKIEHTAARINFPNETYIAVINNVYILESLNRELGARNRLLPNYKTGESDDN
jgi:hypothetical protein